MVVPRHLAILPPGRGTGRWPGLFVVPGVFLVPYDRLLAGVVMAACGHRLIAPLVGAPVAGLPGPVPRLTVGGALTLTVPRPLALPGIAALALAGSVRPAHFPTPFRCRTAALLGTPQTVCWQWVLPLPRSPPHSHMGGERRAPFGTTAAALRPPRKPSTPRREDGDAGRE